MIDDTSANYWIGLTDIEGGGNWNLLDGDAYDASDLTQQALYYWLPGEPNNIKTEHCGLIYNAKGLDNYLCQNDVAGVKPIKGICEICESWSL